MQALFFATAAITIASATLGVSRTIAVHGLLWMLVAFLGIAHTMWLLGATFAAALMLSVYAGAVAMLFLFVVILFDIGTMAASAEAKQLTVSAWAAPLLAGGALAGVLLAALPAPGGPSLPVDARMTGLAMYGPYAVAAELASFLLLAGLAGAFHIGRRRTLAAEGSP
ncbi:MAG: hypothetical protein RLZZ383_2842 [Pseudomonadota bacterium]|jgi:NADH-quinone oxidoreductase subunit J